MKPEKTLEEAISIVKNIIYEVNGTPVSKIEADDSLITDLAMDSVELIDFILRLEEFNVIINESQLTNTLTIKQISELMIK